LIKKVMLFHFAIAINYKYNQDHIVQPPRITSSSSDGRTKPIVTTTIKLIIHSGI